MFFFFKRSTIHLDVFTYRRDVFEFYPVDYTEKFFPEWWKNMPNQAISLDGFSPMGTIKRCVGVSQYYGNGITIPLWSDLALNVMPENLIWQFSDRETDAMPHPDAQMDGYLDMKNYRHLKIISPWYFRCKEEIRWLWSQPTWNFQDPSKIIVPPANIEYKYNPGTNINIFINADQPRVILLESGQVMANVYPLSERKLKIHKHLVSREEYAKIDYVSTPTKFLSKYLNNKKIMKSKEKKCPFHL